MVMRSQAVKGIVISMNRRIETSYLLLYHDKIHKVNCEFFARCCSQKKLFDPLLAKVYSNLNPFSVFYFFLRSIIRPA